MDLSNETTVAVIGDGTTKYSIATLAALVGHDVCLPADSTTARHEVDDRIDDHLETFAAAGRPENADVTAARDRIVTMADTASAVEAADVVVDSDTGEVVRQSEPTPAHSSSQVGCEQPATELRADGGTDFETIRLEYPETGVAHLVLNRPDDLNTVTNTMLEELDEALDRIEANGDARALLVTGAGDAFCGGADVSYMADGLEPFEAVAFSRTGQRVFGRLTALPMPVVAGVDGFCLGGGMELATCVDILVASEQSTFGQPELNLGILPGWGGTQRLRHLVGERRAREILLTAERYDAETMREYGFVNELVDDEDLTDRALELATELADGPPLAQAATKNAMLAGRTDTEAGLRAESDAFGLLWTTEDAVEGVDAFRNRRSPEFEGQ